MIITGGIYKGRKILAPSEKLPDLHYQKQDRVFLTLCILYLEILITKLF